MTTRFFVMWSHRVQESIPAVCRWGAGRRGSGHQAASPSQDTDQSLTHRGSLKFSKQPNVEHYCTLNNTHTVLRRTPLLRKNLAQSDKLSVFVWGQLSWTYDDVLRQNMTKQDTQVDGSHHDAVCDYWCTSNQRLGAANGQYYSAERSISVCICNNKPLQLQGTAICTQE